MGLKIKLTSLLVKDQTEARRFYTDVLGFVVKTEIPLGEFKWLTVVSPEGPDDLELVLEPVGYPFAATYQQTLFDEGIPATAFWVDDVQQEYERLKGLGVAFRKEPTKTAGPTLAQFDDTCGNYIQIFGG